MKLNLRLTVALALALLMVAPHASLVASAGQKQKRVRERRVEPQDPAKVKAEERLEPDESGSSRPDVPEETLANRREQMSEDDEGSIPYYNNFLSSYRLGPEDVVSITVFGLDRYSKSGIVVPPDGRIDYYFIRDGLLVAGKTTRQVADEITEHLDEYIIDPKVTVSLEKAMSARYGIVGDVAQPGVRIMSRRLSVYEALAEAGGVLPTGDKKKVVVLHWNVDRVMERVTIDVAAIEKGKAADNYFLRPGDQIFVPGNRYKTVKEVLNFLPIISFARIFTGGW